LQNYFIQFEAGVKIFNHLLTTKFKTIHLMVYLSNSISNGGSRCDTKRA
jgi:hypothetical protein